MDKKYYIELLDRFYQGLTSEEENKILKDWMKSQNSREDFYAYYQQCWHLAPNEMDKETQDVMLTDILLKIDKSSENSEDESVKQSIFKPIFLRYVAAACIVLVFGLGAYFLGYNQTNSGTGIVAMSVNIGQKADIALADGTHVYVNSDSRISYDNSFNKKERVITLEGEAYFDVAKDKKRPFIVKAHGIDVQALGTSFNVKAHSNDKTVSVILIEGKVRVKDDKQERTLNPNERLEYNLAKKEFKKSELKPNSNELLWRSNELAFYGESFEEICNNLTRMYNCKFIFKTESSKHFTYNGIIKNNSLENVLDFICQSASIKYEKRPDNTIIIY
ncbi:MAG: FecR family protein [Bacteroidota bacterium]|nr:FecR family protein [Bacteroidota bacterium]